MPPENPIRDSWLHGFENGLIVGGLRVGAGWSFLENGRRGAIRRIRVAQGTYKPDENEGGNVILGDRGATFTMANGVHVSGGYRGLSGGGEPDDHDHDAFVTILSGDIGTPDNNSDNSYHVVNGSAVTSPTKLAGYTITSGNADQGIPEDDPNSSAGGLYIEAGNVFPVFCRFTDNSAARGGAIYIRELGQASRVARCTFDNNTADSFGGGFGGAIMILATSSPIIAQCRFTNNFSPAGGAIYMSNECDPKVVDCLFANNSSHNGGAMLIGNGSNPRIRSCTIVENSASVVGGGVLVTGVTSAEPTFDNCVIWDNSDSSGGGKEAQIYSDDTYDTQNPVVNSTCILGGWSGLGGAGVINVDPQFADEAFRLSSGSPCHDAGDNTAFPGQFLQEDLDGHDRFVDDPLAPDTGNGAAPIVDMGAYEFQVCEGDIDGDGSVDPLDSGFVLSRFGCDVGTGDPNCDTGDQNGDGLVDPLDVGFVLARFGPCE